MVNLEAGTALSHLLIRSFCFSANSTLRKILDHGRMGKNKIITMDNEIDSGDGHKKGKIRWYECYGIDCDEGWESRFSD